MVFVLEMDSQIHKHIVYFIFMTYTVLTDSIRTERNGNKVKKMIVMLVKPL